MIESSWNSVAEYAALLRERGYSETAANFLACPTVADIGRVYVEAIRLPAKGKRKPDLDHYDRRPLRFERRFSEGVEL